MKVNFGGTIEEVVTREEFPLARALQVKAKRPTAVVGYGPQGEGQSKNLRDLGFNVHLGLNQHYSGSNIRRRMTSWEKALADGWEPGINLFHIEDAARRAEVVAYLIADGPQVDNFHLIKPHLTRGDMLYVSHGLPVHFTSLTGIVAPDGVDVVMVAPKGAGSTVRANFEAGSGINSSYAVVKDTTGRALERVLAMGMGIGSGYMFQTTAASEVITDHAGERGFNLGATAGLAKASFDVLTERYGLSSREAAIQSSEQLTQVIIPLIGKNGCNEIYRQARAHGQLATVIRYQRAIRDATVNVFADLYPRCASGEEARIALDSNRQAGYKDRLDAELDRMDVLPVWKAVAEARLYEQDRTYGGKITNFALAGAMLGGLEAQFLVFANNRHSNSENGNETVEELTQSLNPIYQREGMAGLIRHCSSTAQRGSLDWAPVFERAFRAVFDRLEREYAPSESGFNPIHNYTSIGGTNMWNVLDAIRELRPENQRRA